jgi:hypothetical protein
MGHPRRVVVVIERGSASAWALSTLENQSGAMVGWWS